MASFVPSVCPAPGWGGLEQEVLTGPCAHVDRQGALLDGVERGRDVTGVPCAVRVGGQDGEDVVETGGEPGGHGRPVGILKAPGC